MTADEIREEENRQYQRNRMAGILGGARAVDTYTKERFTVTDRNRAAYEAAVAFDPMADNLYLCGPAGSGKTHLAAIALRTAMKHPKVQWSARTITQMELSRQVRGTEAHEEQRIINDYSCVPGLCIDDIGIAKDTEFMMTLLYEVINGRYMDKPGGLIVTSNLSLDHLAQKFGDDRIPSRLAQMCKVFNLQGEKDYRLVKAAERKEKA